MRPIPVSWPVSWAELHRDTRILARGLAALGPFRGIVAVARGGLVPAALVARALDVRRVDTICIATYDERVRGEPTLLNGLDAEWAGSNGAGLLVVDDLVDTGTTFGLVRRMLPAAHLATVYAKPAGRAAVDSFVTLFGQDTWIVFPWEQDEPQALSGG